MLLHGLTQEALKERPEPKEIRAIPELRDPRAKREKLVRRESKVIPEQQERRAVSGTTVQE